MDRLNPIIGTDGANTVDVDDSIMEYDPLNLTRQISELRDTEFYPDALQAVRNGDSLEEYMLLAWQEVQIAGKHLYIELGLELDIGSICLTTQQAVTRKKLDAIMIEQYQRTQDPQLAAIACVNYFRDAFRLAEAMEFLDTNPDLSGDNWPEECAGETRIYTQEGIPGDNSYSNWKVVSVFNPYTNQ